MTNQQEILAATQLAWEDFVDSPEAIDHAVELIEDFDAEKLLAEVPQQCREICFSWGFLGGARRIFRKVGEPGGVW